MHINVLLPVQTCLLTLCNTVSWQFNTATSHKCNKDNPNKSIQPCLGPKGARRADGRGAESGLWKGLREATGGAGWKEKIEGRRLGRPWPVLLKLEHAFDLFTFHPVMRQGSSVSVVTGRSRSRDSYLLQGVRAVSVAHTTSDLMGTEGNTAAARC